MSHRQEVFFSGYDDFDMFATVVALGYIPGWTTFRKFGMNPDVDAGVEQCWPPGTIQVLPAVGGEGVVSVVSSSASDAAAGVGARTLTINGLDSGYELISETITLDGITPVTTTKEFYRVYRAFTVTAGSSETNVGNISLSIGGALQAYIEATEGQTHITQYTVPSNHVLILDYYAVNSGRQANSDLSARFQIRTLGGAWRTMSDVFPYEGLFTINEPRIIVPEKTDVRILIESTAVNANASAEYSGHLVDMAFLPLGHNITGSAED